MGRILAIDYGTKRIGLAVTDALQLIASPLKTIHSADAFTFLKSYIAQEQVEALVLGEPRHQDGALSGPIESLENFEKALKRFFPDLPVYRIDERFTSKIASQTIAMSGKTKKKKENKEEVDLIAATIILQSYLEQRFFADGRK
jgi:putative Holliday junction resolvase